MRIVETRRGARLVEGGTVLSEIIADPGPTHSLFDVLAAAIATLSPGPRVALLGFAGGGLVAPLRALGFDAPLEAVDLSLEGAKVFDRLAGTWTGQVTIDQDDAARWLGRKRVRYDFILEDLFAMGKQGMVKPDVSFAALPGSIRRHLQPAGVAVFNTLREPGKTWAQIHAPLLAPFARACAIHLDDYENRVLVAGRRLPDAREVSRRVGESLRALGSRQAGKTSVAAVRIPSR